MNIALLTDGIFPYVIGGMQKHSFQLAQQLARKGHTVYLFHCHESKYDASKLEFFSEEERKNIKSFVIPFPHKSYYPLHYISESHQYSKLILEALTTLLPEIDFVFAQGFCGWALLEQKRIIECPPVAVHFHGLEMFQNIPSLKTKISAYFLRKAVKQNLQLADYIISFGGKLTTLLLGIVPKKKIWEVPGGIEKSWLVDKAETVKENVRFAFVGRYERRKGLPELTEAINHLLPNHNFTFDFIGDIPADKGIYSPKVKYHGRVDSEKELQNILSNCDVLVCPSYAEGMPIVIMEAMSRGLAIIATNVGAVSALVNDSNGWLLPNPQPKEIETAMIDAINAKSNLITKKEHSLEKIKKSFLLDSVVDALLQKIESSIK